MTPAVVILVELVRLGIQLRADGEQLLYRPRERVCPALSARLTAQKADLLAMLQFVGTGAETTPTESRPPLKPAFTDDEQRVVSMAPEHVKAMVAEVKAMFADLGEASLINLVMPPSGQHDLPYEPSRGPGSRSTPISH